MLLDNKGIAKSDSLAQSNPLGKEALEGKPLDCDRYIKIKLTCNKSFDKPKYFFCNKVDSKEKSSIRVQRIIELKEADGSNIKYEDFNFIPENFLERNKGCKGRIDSILNLYGLSFSERKYIKAVSKGKMTNVGNKLPKDTLRIFIEKNMGVWDVVLIDPWHLIATEKYRDGYSECLKKKRFRFNIEDL